MTRKLTPFIAAAIILVGAGGFGLYRLGETRGAKQMDAGTAIPTQNAGEHKPLYWHDPMVPGQRFDHPGKSPFMEMQLVPVYADDGGTTAAVHIDSRVQQNLGMRTAPVVIGTLARTLEAPGSVAFDEREARVLDARAAGFVERLHVRATLDRVRRGQPLADLYSPDWVAVQEEFLAVNGLGADAGAGLLDAARQRMRLVGMSEAQIRTVESAGHVQPRLSVVSPVDGVVSELGAREGMTVAPGTLLFRINGLGTVWIQAEVPESASETLAVGTAAEVRADALPGQVFRARVIAVPANVALETRTRTVRLELANPRGDLVPGMFTTVRFSPTHGEPTLLVPTEAVIATGARTVVIVAGNDGAFSPVDVEVGREGNGQTEILSGLNVGQRVVVSGQFLINSEASLTGSLGRLSAAPPTSGDATGTEKRP